MYLVSKESTQLSTHAIRTFRHDLLRNETVYTGGDIIIQVVRDIAQGLRFLHASKPPILHRDLKARNILIDSRFRAKVADFGLAAKTKTARGLTGTPYWYDCVVEKISCMVSCFLTVRVLVSF